MDGGVANVDGAVLPCDARVTDVNVAALVCIVIDPGICPHGNVVVAGRIEVERTNADSSVVGAGRIVVERISACGRIVGASAILKERTLANTNVIDPDRIEVERIKADSSVIGAGRVPGQRKITESSIATVAFPARCGIAGALAGEEVPVVIGIHSKVLELPE
jgi:hypothetical protein